MSDCSKAMGAPSDLYLALIYRSLGAGSLTKLIILFANASNTFFQQWNIIYDNGGFCLDTRDSREIYA